MASRSLAILAVCIAVSTAGTAAAYSDGNQQYWLWKDQGTGAPAGAQTKSAETRVGTDTYRLVVWTTQAFGDVRYEWVKNQGAATGTGLLTSQSQENDSANCAWAAIMRTEVINTSDGTILAFVGFENTDYPDYAAVRAYRFNPGASPNFTEILRLRDVNFTPGGGYCNHSCGSYWAYGGFTVTANANPSGKGYDLFVPGLATVHDGAYCGIGSTWSILRYNGNGAVAAGIVTFENLAAVPNASPDAATFQHQSFDATYDHNANTPRVFYHEKVGTTFHLKASDPVGNEITLQTFGNSASNAVFAAGSGLTGTSAGAMVAWKNPVNNSTYVRDFRTNTTRQVRFDDNSTTDGEVLSNGSFQLLPSRQPLFVVQRNGLVRAMTTPAFTASTATQFVARNVVTLYSNGYDPTGTGALPGMVDMQEANPAVPTLFTGNVRGTWSTFNPATGDVTVTSPMVGGYDKYSLASTINGQPSFTPVTQNFTNKFLELAGNTCLSFAWAELSTMVDVSPEYIYKLSATISNRGIWVGSPSLRLRSFDPTIRDFNETTYYDLQTGSNAITLTHTFAGRPNVNTVAAFVDLYAVGAASMSVKVDQLKVERVAVQGWGSSTVGSWNFNNGLQNWSGGAFAFGVDACAVYPGEIPSYSWQLNANNGQLNMSCDRNMFVSAGVPVSNLTAGTYRVRFKSRLTNIPPQNASPTLRLRFNGPGWSASEIFAGNSVWSTDNSSALTASKSFFLTVPAGRTADLLAIDLYEHNPGLGDVPDTYSWTLEIDDVLLEKL